MSENINLSSSRCSDSASRRCSPALQLGAGSNPTLRLRRQRPVLPLHLRLAAGARPFSTPLCAVVSTPALVERLRSLAPTFGFHGLWSTSSLRLARIWLMQHPRCQLFVLECDGNKLLLVCPQTGQCDALSPPYLASELTEAIRKFCHPPDAFFRAGR